MKLSLPVLPAEWTEELEKLAAHGNEHFPDCVLIGALRRATFPNAPGWIFEVIPVPGTTAYRLRRLFKREQAKLASKPASPNSKP